MQTLTQQQSQTITGGVGPMTSILDNTLSGAMIGFCFGLLTPKPLDVAVLGAFVGFGISSLYAVAGTVDSFNGYGRSSTYY